MLVRAVLPEPRSVCVRTRNTEERQQCDRHWNLECEQAIHEFRKPPSVRDVYTPPRRHFQSVLFLLLQNLPRPTVIHRRPYQVSTELKVAVLSFGVLVVTALSLYYQLIESYTTHPSGPTGRENRGKNEVSQQAWLTRIPSQGNLCRRAHLDASRPTPSAKRRPSLSAEWLRDVTNPANGVRER